MNQFEEWLQTRPKVVQDLAKKYPPGQYIIKQGAPYGVSCEGTEVTLTSYKEDGMVSVVVEAKNKVPAALKHEEQLAIQHGKKDQLKQFHANNVLVEIDPMWMTLLEAIKYEE